MVFGHFLLGTTLYSKKHFLIIFRLSIQVLSKKEAIRNLFMSTKCLLQGTLCINYVQQSSLSSLRDTDGTKIELALVPICNSCHRFVFRQVVRFMLICGKIYMAIAINMSVV